MRVILSGYVGLSSVDLQIDTTSSFILVPHSTLPRSYLFVDVMDSAYIFLLTILYNSFIKSEINFCVMSKEIIGAPKWRMIFSKGMWINNTTSREDFAKDSGHTVKIFWNVTVYLLPVLVVGNGRTALHETFSMIQLRE